MALSVNQVWEVRTTGSDANGGAFRAGSGGTDYSQQDAAQVAVADAVANGTTTITSATASFSSAHVGNVIYLAGGSGALAAARREVISVTSATAVVVDASVASGTGITLNLGGALLTLGELSSSTRGMVACNKAFIKSGNYAIAAGVTFAQNVGSPNQTTPPTDLVGYKTVRGDITPGTNASSRPVIQTNAALTALTFSSSGWVIRNLVVGAGSSTPTTGFFISGGSYVDLTNCATTAYTNIGIYFGVGIGGVTYCEATGGSGSPSYGIQLGGSNANVAQCYVHDGAGAGILLPLGANAISNVVANMTGATADGISVGHSCLVLNNTVYACGRHGINVTNCFHASTRIKGNVLSNNGGYGLTMTGGAGLAARWEWDGNAYYSNTSGGRNNLDDTTVNAVNGVAPYANALDVACTASPFTNAAGGDFTLNNTAGGGAGLRAAGPFNGYPGLTQAGYRDFGPFQHRDSGSTITYFIEG